MICRNRFVARIEYSPISVSFIIFHCAACEMKRVLYDSGKDIFNYRLFIAFPRASTAGIERSQQSYNWKTVF